MRQHILVGSLAMLMGPQPAVCACHGPISLYASQLLYTLLVQEHMGVPSALVQRLPCINAEYLPERTSKRPPGHCRLWPYIHLIVS